MKTLKTDNPKDVKITYRMLSGIDTLTFLEKERIVKFLHKNLEQYGDKPEDIEKAIDYATSKFHHQGGFLILAEDGEELAGVVVVLKTGMEGYIPENILVYIATHSGYRGKGIGKGLMKKTIEMANGDIALHVEPDNPARHLYEKYGFTNKYLEMRYHRK